MICAGRFRPLAAGDVVISVDVGNFTLPCADGKNGQGRIVYCLDASVPTYYEHSAISKAGTYAISSDTAYTWKEVTPGEHKFSVQLADNILVSLSVSDFIISREDIGVVNRIGEGHLIYYIDEAPPVDQGLPATTATSIVSTSTSHMWKGVTEGQHTFSAQLVNNDDTPLETPVVIKVKIDVKSGVLNNIRKSN